MRRAAGLSPLIGYRTCRAEYFPSVLPALPFSLPWLFCCPVWQGITAKTSPTAAACRHFPVCKRQMPRFFSRVRSTIAGGVVCLPAVSQRVSVAEDSSFAFCCSSFVTKVAITAFSTFVWIRFAFFTAMPIISRYKMAMIPNPMAALSNTSPK